MTEAEFFNAGLKCGDLPIGALDQSRPYSVGCGARDWRVFTRFFFDPHDRILECGQCGQTTLVTVEKVGDEVGAPE